jgi:biotin operon repressor
VSTDSSSTKGRIVQTVRRSEEPALSSAQIAAELGFSKRAVNDHMDDLVESGRLKVTKIGNANAYYILSDSASADHTCVRCGRAIYRDHAYAKLELSEYKTQRHGPDTPPSLYIICRLCLNDVVNFLHSLDGSIGDYPWVHSWNIPNDQLEEVRADDDTRTSPQEDILLTEAEEVVFKALQAYDDGTGTPIMELVTFMYRDDIAEAHSLDSELDEEKIREVVPQLEEKGLAYHGEHGWRPAK